MHDLRDAVLFNGRGRSGYDRHHPDDRSAANHFMGFWQGGELLGTLRVDFLGCETAVLRLVAIEPRFQRRGIGRAMIAVAERFISTAGRSRVVTNAAIDAVGFLDLDMSKRPGTIQVRKWPEKRSLRCRNG